MKIKKGWKITWITLGSLLGLVVVVLVVALWLVLTPSRLTSIVNGLTDKFITCEAKFGNVDLTLLSTFPDAGLKIEDVVIINPMEGADNDTLAKIGSLTVGIDVMAFLKENKVIVHQVKLDDAQANLYMSSNGESNFDIFPPNEKEDTGSAALPELIDLKKIKVNNLNARFVDKRDGKFATVNNLGLALKGSMKDKDIVGDLKLNVAKLLVDMPANRMMANVDGLELKADGAMKGEDIDADVRLGAKGLECGMKDSLGNQILLTVLEDVVMKLDGKGTMEEVIGDLEMRVERGKMKVGETEMVNEKLQASKKDLLKVELPHVMVSLKEKKIGLNEGSKIKIDDYSLALAGSLGLAYENQPMNVEMRVETEGWWRVKPLLDIVPQQYVSFRKGMDMDGKVSLSLDAVGALTDSTMPAVTGMLQLDKGSFYWPKMVPYKLSKIKGKLTTEFHVDRSNESWVKIEGLKAHTQGTDVAIDGRVDDLMGDMRVDAKIKGILPLEDIKPMVPKGMKFDAKGDADLDLKVACRMSQLQKQDYDKVKASGSLKLKDLDVDYDTLHATTKHLDIALQMPSKQKGKMADVQIVSGKLNVVNGKKMDFDLENATIKVGVNNLMKEQMAAVFDIEVGETDAKMDSTIVLLSEMKLGGSVRFDSTNHNIIKQYNPRFNVTVDNVLFYTTKMPENVRITEFDMSYNPAGLDIRTAKVKMGHSDFELYGTVENIEDWLDDKAILKGDLNFTSDYADVDQMMSMFSGMGSDKDSLEMMRKEDEVPAEVNPFIVPRNVNLTLHTHIKRSIAFGNDLHDVAGALTVNDGKVVLDQIGFVCKAATMQLTALYRSPRPNNLFYALDFHLLDIQIHELLEMIPAVDTLVPMLSVFDGNANFHLAGEMFLDARYQPKWSSLKGAAAITGKDLTVMDDKKVSDIAKLLTLKSKKEKDDKIRIDSMSVEMTCMDVGFGTEVEILPFVLNMGNYQVCASGVQSLGTDCNYHLELLKSPLLVRIGVDVRGDITNPKISLGKVLYADLYRPKYHGVAEKKALEIKNKVRQALEANVR